MGAIPEESEGRHAFKVTIAYLEGTDWVNRSKIITTRDWRGGDILTLAFRGFYSDLEGGPRLEAVQYLGEGYDMPSCGTVADVKGDD